MKTKKIVKLVQNFLDKNLGEQYFLDEIIYDCLGLKIDDRQFEEVEKEFLRTDRFK